MVPTTTTSARSAACSDEKGPQVHAPTGVAACHKVPLIAQSKTADRIRRLIAVTRPDYTSTPRQSAPESAGICGFEGDRQVAPTGLFRRRYGLRRRLPHVRRPDQ